MSSSVYRHLQAKGASTDEMSFSLLQTLVWHKMIQRKGLFGKLTSALSVLGDYQTFVIASHGTSTSTVAFLVYMLSQNASAEGKLCQEIDSFLAYRSPTEPLTLADLKSLKYLEACISETLRLYTPTPILGRTLGSAIQLDDGTFLPAGVDAFIYLPYIHSRDRSVSSSRATKRRISRSRHWQIRWLSFPLALVKEPAPVKSTLEWSLNCLWSTLSTSTASSRPNRRGTLFRQL